MGLLEGEERKEQKKYLKQYEKNFPPINVRQQTTTLRIREHQVE